MISGSGLWAAARLEVLALHRRCSAWALAAMPAWLLLVRGQEPRAFRLQRVDLAWSGAEAGLIWLLAGLPLVWILGHRQPERLWTLRSARSVALPVAAAWIGLCSYCALTLAAYAILWFTVLRIFGDPASAGAVAGRAAAVGVGTVPLLAFAPALALAGLAPTRATLLWVGLLALAWWRGLPGITAPLEAARALAAWAALTAAGLLLSGALAQRQCDQA